MIADDVLWKGFYFFPFIGKLFVEFRDFDIFGSFKINKVGFNLLELNLNIAFPQPHVVQLLGIILFQFAFLFGQHLNLCPQLLDSINALADFLLELFQFLGSLGTCRVL